MIKNMTSTMEKVMMQRSADEFERARSRMADDLKAMIADGEDMLKAATTASGDGFALARTQFEKKLQIAKAGLIDTSRPMLDKTREIADTATIYMRGNPWTAAGVVIVAGVLIGMLAARR